MVTLQEDTRAEIAYRAKIRSLEQQVGRLESEAVRRAREVLDQVRQEVIEELRNTPSERFRAFFLRELERAVGQRIAALEPRLQAEISGKILQALEAGQRSVDQSMAVFGIQPALPDIPQQLVDVVQGFTADLIRRISDETRAQINAILATAILRGDTVLDAARRIGRSLNQPGTAFGGISLRAERIARTEILRAYSIAQQGRIRQVADYVPGLKKQWVATLDERARREHRLAHGQIRNWDEPFDVGGEKLMYPRDPGGSPGNTIQCRCIHVAIPPEFEEQAQLAPPEERVVIPPRFEEERLPFVPPPPPKPTAGLPKLTIPKELLTAPPAVPLDATTIGKREPALSQIMTMKVARTKDLGGTGITPDKLKVTLENGKQAIFKPASGVGLHDIRPGTDHIREKAAYLTARHFGSNVVPATQIREFGGKTGSIQLWARGKPARKIYRDSAEWLEVLKNMDYDSLHEMAVLDYVTNNRDRHADNFLIYKARGKFRVVAIDNGLAFAPKRDSWLNDQGYEWVVRAAEAGGPAQISQRLWNGIRRVNAQNLTDDLSRTGLTTTEINGAVERLRLVQQYGLSALFRFPVSGLKTGIVDGAKRMGMLG